MKTPIGFITLCEAVDAVGRAVLGTSWQFAIPFNLEANHDDAYERVITMIAEGCEAGQIAAGYRAWNGAADDLDRSAWRMPHWRNYFATGTIELIDLPLLDPNNGWRPVPDGRTVPRCTREVFVRRDNLDRFIASIAPASEERRKPARHRHAGDAELAEEGRDLVAGGMSKRKAAEKLALRAEGGTIDQRIERLRKLI
jgi:hypothetical protein